MLTTLALSLLLSAAATDKSKLPVEDPEGLISDTVTARAHFVSTDSSPIPVLRAVDDQRRRAQQESIAYRSTSRSSPGGRIRSASDKPSLSISPIESSR